MRSHKIYWDLTRSTRISQDLPRSHFEITLRLHFGICHDLWNLTFEHFTFQCWHFGIWHRDSFDILTFYIWHMTLTFCLYVEILRVWHVDISILKLWHLTLTLTLYYNTVSISLLDSAVICNPKKISGFRGYLSWILWLSIMDSVVIWHQHRFKRC